MTYPVTIVDNFFEDPDEIVKLAEELKWYPPETGNWPGLRTKQLHLENERLFNYIGEKIQHLFHDTIPDYWELQAHFQKIEPFSDDQWDKRNQGWIHQDIDTHFGGIVYLSKNPEPNTGTSIYKTKQGYCTQYLNELKIKERHYLGEDIPDEEYDEAFNAMMDQFVETVTVENVYNRLVLFNSKTYHGVKTFGNKPRLTLNFFGMGMSGKLPPIMRSR